MSDEEERPADYVHAFTIAPLPGVTDEQLERHIIDDVLPHFEVTHRPIGAVELKHSLLKATGGDRLDRYVWEIRLRFRQRVQAPDQAALDRMDELVRAGLESFGLAVSLTALQELHVADTI
jgi:hypothetical protein